MASSIANKPPPPPNLTDALCGIDWTNSSYSETAQRANLFDLDKMMRSSTQVECSYSPVGSQGESGNITYSVPTALGFTWGVEEKDDMVAGVWKSEFLRNLAASIDIMGNPDSISKTSFAKSFAKVFWDFWSDGMSETDNKYALLSRHRPVYSIDWGTEMGPPYEALTAQASDDISGRSGMSVEDMIKTYGTHFMLKAKLGGVQLHGADLNVRNLVTKEQAAAGFAEYLRKVGVFCPLSTQKLI